MKRPGLAKLTRQQLLDRVAELEQTSPAPDALREAAWYRGIVDALPNGVLTIDGSGIIRAANPAAEQMLGYRRGELIGMEIGAVVPCRAKLSGPDSAAASYEAGIWQDGSDTRIQVNRKDGNTIWAQFQTTDAEISGGSFLILTLRNAEGHPKSEEMLHQRERPEAIISRLSLRALAAGDTATLFKDVLEAVAETMKTQYVGILRTAADGRALRLEAGLGWIPGNVGVAVLPGGAETHAGFALLSGEPVILGSPHPEKRFGPATLLEAHGIVSGIALPIPGKIQPCGVLISHSASPREFADEDVHFLKAVANVLSIALQRFADDEEIRRSEARLRTLLAGAAQLIWAIAGDGSLIEDSPSWREFTGQSYAEASARGWMDSVHPEDRTGLLESWRTAADTKVTNTGKFRIRDATGEWRWIKVRVAPLVSPDGTLDGWVGMGTDVSERKAEKEALRASQASLQTALFAGKVVTFDWNCETDVVLRSPNAEQIFQWPGASLEPGKIFFGRIHPSDKPRLDNVIENLAKNGGSYQERYRVVRPDGSILWLESNAQGVFDSNGSLIRLHGIAKDITQRVEIEQSLAELQRTRDDSLALLETLLAHAPIGIALVDRSYRYVRMNKELSSINGLPPEVSLGAHVWEVIPTLWPQVGPLYRHVLEKGEAITDHEVSGYMRTRPGELLHWRVSYYPVRTSADITGVGVIVVDVTERKHAEQEVMESRKRLSGIVDSALDAIITIDEEQRVLVFNAAAEKMFRCPATEVIGTSVDRFIPARFRTASFSMSGPLGREVSPFRDLTAMRADGEEFPIEASLSEIEVSGERLFTAIVRDVTERKRIEQDLLFQLQLTRAITDQAADAIFVTDNDARVTFANPEAERIFGFSADELRGERLHDLIRNRPQDVLTLGASDCPLEAIALRGSTIRNYEDVFFRKDGTAVMVVCSSAPVEVSGKRIGTVLVAHNITQRKRAEEALRRSEERFRQIADSMPQIVWTVEPNGVWDYVNRNFATYTGTEPGSGVGVEVLHPDDKGPTLTYWRRAFESGQPFETEHRIRRADGVYRWHLSRGIPVRDPAGQIEKWYATTTDIHERKQLEEALRSQAEMVELSHDAIILWRDPGGIEFWNRGAAALYGYERKDAIGQNPHKLLQTRFQRSRSRIEREMRKKEFWEGEVRQRARDGHEVIVSSRLQLMPGSSDGRLVLEISRDITESKRLERAVLEISGREQQRIGQDLHDDLCQRLAGVELRAQALASDLAARSDAEAVTAEAITERIREAIAHTRLLARGLSPVAMETDGLVSALEQLASSTAEIFRIRCTFTCTQPVLQRNAGAATHLYRIAQEAISNAVRHGRATVVALSLEHQEGRICLLICDNGRGIPHDQPKSTGMGLRIMQYRAGMIGATLELRPGSEGGTEVACNFPKDL